MAQYGSGGYGGGQAEGYGQGGYGGNARNYSVWWGLKYVDLGVCMRP